MKKIKKGFIASAEIVVLTVIIGVVSLIVLSSTVKTTQQNFDTDVKTKIQRDLWGNR